MQTRKEQIRAFVADEIAGDVPAEDLPFDYDLIETGIVDSLSLVRLVSWLGETFDVSVHEVILDPADFSTVDRIDAFIEHSRLEDA